MMRDAHGPASLLVRADDKFAFAFRRGRQEVTRREGREWKQSFQPSIPFLVRLELCHVEINCFTRPRNIVTRTFESRDVGSTGLSCKQPYLWERTCVN